MRWPAVLSKRRLANACGVFCPIILLLALFFGGPRAGGMVLLSFLVSGVAGRLLWTLFRVTRIDNFGLFLAVAHFLFVCAFAPTVYYAYQIDHSALMLWIVPAVLDFPISMLGLALLPFVSQISFATGIHIWGPWAFFGVLGSLQYYFLGKSAQAHSAM